LNYINYSDCLIGNVFFIFNPWDALMKSKILLLSIFVIVILAGIFTWHKLSSEDLPEGLYGTNGRLEAEQVQVATKSAGRVTEVVVEEGQLVKAGDVLVRMDSNQLNARKREAQAQIETAKLAWEEAEAGIAQKQAQLKLATRELERTKIMFEKKMTPQDTLDQAETQFESAKAGLSLSEATSKRALASIDAAQAALEEIDSLLDDTVIKAPRNGRVQYVLAQPGEVLSAGGQVITLLDISDVYMTIFVPASIAGKLQLNDEAKLVLDPIPEYVVPSRVSFVATDSQFTPKYVETTDERNNLMFRVKLSIDPSLLKEYEDAVKTGVRGIGYVRTDASIAWTPELTTRLPNSDAK
jgi:HlyD family secretion protein